MVALSWRNKAKGKRKALRRSKINPDQYPAWNKPKRERPAWQVRRSSLLGRRTGAGRLYSSGGHRGRGASYARSSYAVSRRIFVQDTGVHSGAFGADKFG